MVVATALPPRRTIGVLVGLVAGPPASARLR